MKSLKEALVHKHMDHVDNIILKPGDNLQDGDVVLFGYQHSYDKSYAYTNLGMYNAKTGDIEYDDGPHGSWENLKDDFQLYNQKETYQVQFRFGAHAGHQSYLD